MTIYCAWELKWRRDSTGGRWGKVWSPWKEDPGRTHPRRREEALNTAFPLFLPWASWVSRSSLGWCHVTVQASPISMTITEVLAPLPRPACAPAVGNCTHGAAGLHPPHSEDPLEIRVWKLLSSSIFSWRATPQLFPSSIQGSCGRDHVATRLTAQWHPGSRVWGAAGKPRSPPCHSPSHREDLCLHHPFTFSSLPSFSRLLPSSLSFALSGSGTRTSNGAFGLLRLAHLRAGPLKMRQLTKSLGEITPKQGSLSFTQHFTKHDHLGFWAAGWTLSVAKARGPGATGGAKSRHREKKWNRRKNSSRPIQDRMGRKKNK